MIQQQAFPVFIFIAAIIVVYFLIQMGSGTKKEKEKEFKEAMDSWANSSLKFALFLFFIVFLIWAYTKMESKQNNDDQKNVAPPVQSPNPNNGSDYNY
ncbi:hypothetical protein KKF84_09305 [Myxococcota bacterium]|nr:hypothetical protein [Myxococcota bacterium]